MPGVPYAEEVISFNIARVGIIQISVEIEMLFKNLFDDVDK